MSATIRPYTEHDREELVAFVVRLQSDPAHFSAELDDEPAAVAAALDELDPPATQTVLLARQATRLVGAIVAECDAELGRAWIGGPLLDVPDAAWPALADRIWNELRLPHGIHDCTFAGDVRNTRLADFAARHRMRPGQPNTLMRFARADVPGEDLTPLDPAGRQAAAALHDQLFPGSYLVGQQLVQRVGEHRQLLGILEDDLLLGYVYLETTPEAPTAGIDFIGVAPEARRRGIGRRLLTGALRWFFAFDHVEAIQLCVDQSNEAAVRLYRTAGFHDSRTLRGYRRRP